MGRRDSIAKFFSYMRAQRKDIDILDSTVMGCMLTVNAAAPPAYAHIVIHKSATGRGR